MFIPPLVTAVLIMWQMVVPSLWENTQIKEEKETNLEED